MRIRTLVAFTGGAAVGAGLTYLADPDHGRARRVAARRWAIAQGREQATAAGTAAVGAGRTWLVAALDGFAETTRSAATAPRV